MNKSYFNIKKNFKESLDFQKKVLDGVENLMNAEVEEPGISEKTLVYRDDKLSLYHYEPLAKNTVKTPILIVYALVNRETMMDLEENNSFIKNMLEAGLDIYIIDWGYPTIDDKYVSMDDYIELYINDSVDIIMEETGSKKINLLGVSKMRLQILI